MAEACNCGNKEYRVDIKGSDVELRCAKCLKIVSVESLGKSDSGHHSHEKDREQAVMRYEWYQEFMLPGARVLDVESRGQAFVDVCRLHGVEAYACDASSWNSLNSNEFVYGKHFEEVHFPSDYFDVVICFDGVSHCFDRENFVFEVFRVVKQGGTAIVEMQKEVVDRFRRVFAEVGFVDSREEVDDRWLSLIFKKPECQRKSILFPPGIGDVYWSLVKTESLLKREGVVGPVDAMVAVPREKEYNSHARSFPFLSMFPFLYSTGKVVFNKRDKVWKEAYLQQGRTVFRNILGCDYFITWNGYLRAGKTLEEIDPDLTCNWDLPRFVSLVEENYKKESRLKYGDYIVLYWAFQGMNRLLLRHFSIEQIASSINRIVEQSGLTPVLVGAVWDLHDGAMNELKKLLPKTIIDLRGKTTIEELFGLMRGSRAVVGINSGITIMSAVFGVKTVILYSEFYTKRGVHKDFAWNTFPPAVRRTTYFAEFAQQVTEEEFVERTLSVINDKPYPEKCRKGEKSNQDNSVDPGPAIHASISNVTRGDAVTVFCVLRTKNVPRKGGGFTEQYVKRLRNMLDRHVTVPFRFVCLTDSQSVSNVCDVVPLNGKCDGSKGWWSKIEMFRDGLVDTKKVVYFDLDTVILDSIDDIVSYPHEFSALRPWNPANRSRGMCASGMMAWKNDGTYSFLYDEFEQDDVNTGQFKRGDQQYISEKLMGNSIAPMFFQDTFSGVYSYKRNCRRQLCPNARIVCFHGKPRLDQVKDAWVLKNWR